MTQIMNSLFKLIIILYLIIAFHVLNSCTQIRESAGVERKIPDEYSITKNPPLVLPPDYNDLPLPKDYKIKDELSSANIDNEIKKLIESEAKDNISNNDSAGDSSLEDSITKILNEN